MTMYQMVQEMSSLLLADRDLSTKEAKRLKELLKIIDNTKVII